MRLLADRDFRYTLRPSLQPLVLPACALAAGIAAGPALPAGVWGAAAAAFALAALLARRRGVPALLLVLAATICAGAWREVVFREAALARPLARLVDDEAIRAGEAVALCGRLVAPPDVRPGRVVLAIRVERVASPALGERDVEGRASVSVSLAKPGAVAAYRALGLSYGAPVRVRATVSDDLAFRNPGVEPLRARLRRQGTDLAARASPGDVERPGEASGCPVLAGLYRARERGLEALDRAFPARKAGLLRALLLGDGSRLDAETAAAYRESGAYHVIVISGAHVALVAAVVLWPVSRLTRSRWARLAAGTAPPWLYCLMLGSPPPVVRAALTLTIALSAALVWRRAPPANTLAAAAILLLAWDPATLGDASFQLTFATVAAIVLLALPLLGGLAETGRWAPGRSRPYPPVAPPWARGLARALFGGERERRSTAGPFRFEGTAGPMTRALDRLRARRLARWLFATLVTSAAVQFALTPLSVELFHRISPLGAVATIAVDGLLGIALVAGLLFLISSAASPSLATGPAWVASHAVDLANAAAGALAASWTVPSPVGARGGLVWAHVVLAVALAAALARWRPVVRSLGDLARRERRGVRLVVAACVVGAVATTAALVLPPERPSGDGWLRVAFLDVGQGDAALVRFPNGETMLVDAGGRPRFDEPVGYEGGVPIVGERFDVGDRVVCEALLALGVSRLDWVVASHGDVDHVGGFEAVLARLRVGRAIVAAGPGEGRLRAIFEGAGVPVDAVGVGARLEIGGAAVDALWPDARPGGDNDRSLVLRVSLGQRAVLFAGDVEARGERELLSRASASGWSLRADVLKVAHHGSRGSSTEPFLAAVAPAWAVVPAPRVSPYGHPHAEAVARVEASGARVVRLGIEGAVEVATDGLTIRVRAIDSEETFSREIPTIERSPTSSVKGRSLWIPSKSTATASFPSASPTTRCGVSTARRRSSPASARSRSYTSTSPARRRFSGARPSSTRTTSSSTTARSVWRRRPKGATSSSTARTTTRSGRPPMSRRGRRATGRRRPSPSTSRSSRSRRPRRRSASSYARHVPRT